MTLRALNYRNYGIFLIMGNAGFCPSAVSPSTAEQASTDAEVAATCADLRERKAYPATLNPKP